ncbi:adenosylcobinamide-phosphate synthase CbiB [Cohnella caldifontis]|uniref:adenosylcobinamide-phosphate synthase CbiB n=1 Tax=Cohnella caldifontis TaxID=3027471 RepID=UPI0023ED6C64|nr:adenosylcobinamide-phosphate synthase CbiB [Cohnella sp. YIM B05605]
MLFFSWPETLLMLIAALLIDWVIGDPKRIPHPVVWIGKWIALWEGKLLPRPAKRLNGVLLVLFVTGSAFALTWAAVSLAAWIHPWLGYVLQTWLISTTIAVKGLKDAAMLVYKPLSRGDMEEARKYTGYIVGRDTDGLDAPELSRAAVETVAENAVDAFVSPLFFALLGAAPLAMLYRAANTLDSMVGYRNDKYLRFGWASARLDDVLNWIPARLTGLLLGAASVFLPSASPRRAWKSIRTFARLHPSPNSGIPEAAVAGGLGIQLGGVNRYGGVVSERARLGWPLRPLEQADILRAIRLLYGVSYLAMGGLLCGVLGWLWQAGWKP